jgi:hypothetical protein
MRATRRMRRSARPMTCGIAVLLVRADLDTAAVGLRPDSADKMGDAACFLLTLDLLAGLADYQIDWISHSHGRHHATFIIRSRSEGIPDPAGRSFESILARMDFSTWVCIKSCTSRPMVSIDPTTPKEY